MAEHDCGFCEQLYSCAAGIIEKDFYTLAAKLLCEIADNTGGLGPVDNFNLTQIAGETLGPNFYDETLQALQVSLVSPTAFQVTGNVASDSPDSGNPVKIGYHATTSDITAVADDDRVDAVSDKIGRVVTAPYAIPENFVRGTTGDIVDTTSTSVIASAGGALRNYITSITVSNMSAAVATRVDILDGASVMWQGPAAAAGGGYTITFPVPLKGTAATAVNAQCGTTAAQVRVSAAGYTGV